MNYHEIAFTSAVKAMQESMGSRDIYEKAASRSDRDGLGEMEKKFIARRDSFYLSTIGQNGFPYIQHRGGPVGFLKVLNERTLGFVDFSGNRQYISLGNLQDRPQVSLFLMSYGQKARLKIYALARIVSLEENPDLFAQLDPVDYPHRPERMMVFDVQAFDWNCSQHITPRYSEVEIQEAFGPKLARLAELEARLEK